MELPLDCTYRTMSREALPPGLKRLAGSCCRGIGSRGDLGPICLHMETEEEAYRFCWKPYRGKAEVLIRRGKEISLTWVKWRDHGTRIISRSQWDGLAEALDAADFWSLSSPDPQIGRVFDGSRWWFEGRRGRSFHYVDRNSPRPGTPLFNLGQVIFKIVGAPLSELRLS